MILTLLKTIGGFFDWWLGALQSAIGLHPGRQGKGATKVSLSGQWINVRQNGVTRKFSRKPKPDSKALAAGFRRAGRITGILQNDQLLIVDCTLPEAAEAEISEAIALQLDSLTPFTEDEAYFDCAITGRNPAQRLVNVKLAVAPRPLIDEISAVLASVGKRLDRVVAAHIPEGFTRPPQFSLAARPERNLWIKIGGGMLSVAMIGLVVLITAMGLDRRQQEARMLEERLVSELALVLQAKQLEKEISELQRAFTAPAMRRLNAVPVVGVLEEVTRILPDDSWITDIKISPEKINFTGLSGNASGLLKLFEKSAMFRDAAFSAPLTRDQQFKLERFAISLRIVKGEG